MKNTFMTELRSLRIVMGDTKLEVENIGGTNYVVSKPKTDLVSFTELRRAADAHLCFMPLLNAFVSSSLRGNSLRKYK